MQLRAGIIQVHVCSCICCSSSFSPAAVQVLRVMQLSLGIMLQADHCMRGSSRDHAQLWSAVREVMLALKKVSQ